MGSVWTSVGGFATAGGLIAIVACGSVGDAREHDSAPATTEAVTASSHILTPSGAVPSSSEPTMCTTNEISFFSCQVGGKRVSICGAGGKAVYRYGTPGKVELVSNKLSVATRGFSGGGETQVTATNGEYSYTVFDRTSRTSFGTDGRNDPGSISGLVVRRAGRLLSSRTCADEMPVASAARKIIPVGPFVDH